MTIETEQLGRGFGSNAGATVSRPTYQSGIAQSEKWERFGRLAEPRFAAG